MSSAQKSTALLIDGELVPGGGGTFATINPATEEPLGTAADGDAVDMDRAIAAARIAFDESDWSRDTEFRVHCLRQLRDALNAEIELLRDITVAEVGTPISLTYGGQLAKIGPAMAAGNTVVLKPAPDTPWCAAELGRIVAEKTDLPPGVLNIVTSSDHGVGAQLACDPRVDLVAFTGSTATGRAVMTAAAQGIKKVLLELGGKSAFIVLDDADLTAACTKAALAVTRHAGQGCAFTTRLLVPRDRYDDAVAIAAAAMTQAKVGDPTDPTTVCGPVISAGQRDRVQAYLNLAAEEGGVFACGGGRPADLPSGFYIEPTVIAGLTNDARVAREEIFGPVLTVLAHDGDADAVRIANDSPYGLSGTVYGADPERAACVASRLRVGTVNVNGGIWYSADMPFGGYKQSGLGREMGLAGFEEYLQTKAIAAAVD